MEQNTKDIPVIPHPVASIISPLITQIGKNNNLHNTIDTDPLCLLLIVVGFIIT